MLLNFVLTTLTALLIAVSLLPLAFIGLVIALLISFGEPRIERSIL